MMLRTARFLHRFLRPDSSRLVVDRLRLPHGDSTVEALLYRPHGGGRYPGWIALHGLTVTAHRHPSLTQFAQALAAAGNVVLVPEIPAWRALRIELDAAVLTILAGAEHLAAREEVADGGVGVAGFSVAGTQALIAAADPRVADRVATVAAFGAYCDLHRTLAYMFTGEHEWQGVRRRALPDPYGRWIMGANCLPRVPGYGGMEAVAAELRRLATAAGRRGVYAGEALYDELKVRSRARLRGAQRAVWDLFAPPAGQLPRDREAAAELAAGLAEASLRAEPRGDPVPALPRLRCRVALAHGRSDRLIPFTETLRLREAVPPEVDSHGTIIRSFAHSTQTLRLRPLQYGKDAYRFLRLLRYAFEAS